MIVSPEDYKTQIASSLADYSSDVMKVELVAVIGDDFQGTADCLRFISKRIRGDFIFLSSDVICQFNIGDLINYHRTNAADVTIGMIGCRIDEPEKKGGPKKIQVEEDEQEFTCLSSTGRLLMKASVAEVEKVLAVHKSFLYKSDGKLKLRTDLVDSGLYVFSRWIIDLLLENPTLTSVRTELIPYLLQRQFQSREFLQEQIPGIKPNKFRAAKGIDKWLSAKEILPRHQQQLYLQGSAEEYGTGGGGGGMEEKNGYTVTHASKDNNKKSFRTKELCDYILDELLSSNSIPHSADSNINLSSGSMVDHNDGSSVSVPLSKRKGSNLSNLSNEDMSEIERNLSRLATTSSNNSNGSGTNNNKNDVEEDDDGDGMRDLESDFIRCFSYVCESSAGFSGGLLQRVTSAAVYLALNRSVCECVCVCVCVCVRVCACVNIYIINLC